VPQRTLVLIKPDAVYNDWIPGIIKRYCDTGLAVVKQADLTLSRKQVKELYAEHEGKPFMVGLLLGMSSGPSYALILEGEDAIAQVRRLNGATDPYKAEAGTIRRDFLSAGGVFNTVHASATEEDANREIGLILSWL